jgi:hypothetical protein
VKSGFAIAVILTGPSSAPTAIARRVIQLSDPDEAGTRQPYHDGFFHEQQDARELARRVTIVRRCAKKSVAALLDELRRSAEPASARATAVRRSFSEGGSLALRSLRAGLVVGSVIDPKTVGNLHIRAHANEGLLFRTVLEDALRSHGVGCDVIVEKTLTKRAPVDLGRSDREIKKLVDGFGRTLGNPWRAEEKAAATAAWIVLSCSARPLT